MPQSKCNCKFKYIYVLCVIKYKYTFFQIQIPGFARLSNVEFFHTGQEGYTAIYDPRFSLAFLSVGDINEIRPSRVSECSFHYGFSTAIGVIGTNKLMVEDNVIYETVSDGKIHYLKLQNVVFNYLFYHFFKYDIV